MKPRNSSYAGKSGIRVVNIFLNVIEYICKRMYLKMKKVITILLFLAAIMACGSGYNYISEEDFLKDNLHFDNEEWIGWNIWYHPDNFYYKITPDIDSVKRSTLLLFVEEDGEPVFIIRNLGKGESEKCTKETLHASELLKRDYPEIIADDLIKRAEWVIKYNIMGLSSNKHDEYEEGTIFLLCRDYSFYKEPCDVSSPDSILIRKWHHSDRHYHH